MQFHSDFKKQALAYGMIGVPMNLLSRSGTVWEGGHQTLDRLNERGGVDPIEMLMLMTGGSLDDSNRWTVHSALQEIKQRLDQHDINER